MTLFKCNGSGTCLCLSVVLPAETSILSYEALQNEIYQAACVSTEVFDSVTSDLLAKFGEFLAGFSPCRLSSSAIKSPCEGHREI